MAEQKAQFIPGTQVSEPVSNNKYLYLEADIAFKRGDAGVGDGWGVAHELPKDIQSGVWHAPMLAWENIPKGQYGWWLVEGSTAAHKQGLVLRVQKKAEQALGIQREGQNMQEIKEIIKKG